MYASENYRCQTGHFVMLNMRIKMLADDIINIVLYYLGGLCFRNHFPTDIACLFCHLLVFFSKSTFSKNSFSNPISVSNSLDPDQARHRGSNCLQELSADDTCRQIVGKITLTKTADPNGRHPIRICTIKKRQSRLQQTL